MSDGTSLAADIYYPTDPRTGRRAPGRFPVVLSITPYGKRSSVTKGSSGSGFGGDGYYPYLVQRGYLNVVVDVRGTGASGGRFGLFDARERRDGVELARWAARLAGSSGRVGMAGCSYLGLNQIFTAAEAGRGSAVRAIAPCAAGIDPYRDLALGGGIPHVQVAAPWPAPPRALGGAPRRLERTRGDGRLLVPRAEPDLHRGRGRTGLGGSSDRPVRRGHRPLQGPGLRRRHPERRVRGHVARPSRDDGRLAAHRRDRPAQPGRPRREARRARRGHVHRGLPRRCARVRRTVLAPARSGDLPRARGAERRPGAALERVVRRLSARGCARLLGPSERLRGCPPE